MPSISHRSDLRQGFLQRATSGLAALPAGIIRGIVAWLDDWRALRHLAELDHRLLRDVGLDKAELRRSIVVTPRRDSKPQATKDTLIWPTTS